MLSQFNLDDAGIYKTALAFTGDKKAESKR